jgi:type 1 fimbria pilin
MKILHKIAALAAISASFFAAPVMAQDSESYVINLNGSVASNCELTPEGSGNVNVDMLETSNQGFLAIAFSCNSPYTVTLQSQNGGMRHVESGGAVNIDYDVEATFGGFPTTNSASMQATPVVLVSDNDWVNIFLNGGVRSGNLDLSFDNLAEYAVAGTYEDKLTINLAAEY